MSKQNNSSNSNPNYLHAGQPNAHSKDACEFQVAFLKSPVTSGTQTPGWYKDAWVQISSGEMSPYVSEPEKEIIEAKIIINRTKDSKMPEGYEEDQNLVIEQLRASLNNLFQSTSSIQTQVDVQNPTLMASYTPQKDSNTQKNTFPPSPAEEDIYSLADATPTPASSPILPCRSSLDPPNPPPSEEFFEYDCVDPIVVSKLSPQEVNNYEPSELKNRISITKPVNQTEQLNSSVQKPRRKKVKRRMNQNRYKFDSVSLDDPRVKLAFVFGAGFCIGLGTGYMAWRGNLSSPQNTIVLN